MFTSRVQMFSTERKLFALQIYIQENEIFTEWRKQRLPSCGILASSYSNVNRVLCRVTALYTMTISSLEHLLYEVRDYLHQ